MVSLALAAGASTLVGSAGFAGALGAAGITSTFGVALAGSVVSGVAGLAGNIIDQRLFGSRNDVSGQRLDSLSIATASEGESLPFLAGTMRVPGQVIWAATKFENESQAGGKGSALGGGGSVTTFSYDANFAMAYCVGPIDSFGRTWGNSEIIDIDEHTHRDYFGTAGQNADALIVATEGAAPAFRGTAYTVFERMRLDSFGNALPKLEREITRIPPSPGLRGIVEMICGYYNIAVDASGVSDVADVTGYWIKGQPTARSALDPLLSLFRLDIVEVDGGIFIRSRDDTPVVVLAEEALASRDGGAFLTMTRGTKRDIPRKTTLAYLDPARDYAPGTSNYQFPTAVSKRVTGIEFPGALSADAPARLVKAAAVDSLDGLKTLGFSLGPSRLGTVHGDVCEVSGDGSTYRAQITRAVLGGGLRCEARLISSRPGLARGVAGRAGLIDTNPAPGAATAYFLDMAMLTDDEENPHRPWMAVDAGTWRGVTLYRDDGAGYAATLAVPQYSRIGTLNAALGAGPIDGTLDSTNTISVTMRRGGFESVAAAALDDAPINALAIRNDNGEWEALQFATATLVSGSVWTLSDLRRGRRGTEFYQGASAGAPVVALTGPINKVPITPERLGTAFDYRYGPTPLPNDDGTYVQDALTFRGKGLRPYAPVEATVTGGGAADISIAWTARRRIGNDEATRPASHTVRIYSGGTVLRTFAEVEPDSLIYSAADAAADNGGIPPTTVDVGITPANSAYGDGPEFRADYPL